MEAHNQPRRDAAIHRRQILGNELPLVRTLRQA